MTFYLLKSTNEREHTGDVILLKEEVSSLIARKFISKKETYYQIQIDMKSGEDWFANFNTEDEARKVLQELSDKTIADDFMFGVKDNTEKEKSLELLKALCEKS